MTSTSQGRKLDNKFLSTNQNFLYFSHRMKLWTPSLSYVDVDVDVDVGVGFYVLCGNFCGKIWHNSMMAYL